MMSTARARAAGEFWRFAAVGVVGFLVDSAVLMLALKVPGIGLYSGRVVSYFAAATTTWALNRKFTFTQADPSSPFMQWIKFLGANAIGGLANYGVYAAFVTFTAIGPEVPVLGVAAGAVVGLVFNFTINKFWVFRG